jgi:tetratricopeptide (TPR) repeat protein
LISPKNVGVLDGKALALTGLKKYNESIALYGKALAIDPKNVNALNSKGLTLKVLNTTK